MGCSSSKIQLEASPVDPWWLAEQGDAKQLEQWLKWQGQGKVNALDRTGGRGTLLHAAAKHNQLECVKVLVSAGANINAVTKLWGSPLHVAVEQRSAAVVQALLDGGADPMLKDAANKTAMDVALASGSRDIAARMRAAAERQARARWERAQRERERAAALDSGGSKGSAAAMPQRSPPSAQRSPQPLARPSPPATPPAAQPWAMRPGGPPLVGPSARMPAQQQQQPPVNGAYGLPQWDARLVSAAPGQPPPLGQRRSGLPSELASIPVLQPGGSGEPAAQPAPQSHQLAADDLFSIVTDLGTVAEPPPPPRWQPAQQQHAQQQQQPRPSPFDSPMALPAAPVQAESVRHTPPPSPPRVSPRVSPRPSSAALLPAAALPADQHSWGQADAARSGAGQQVGDAPSAPPLSDAPSAPPLSAERSSTDSLFERFKQTAAPQSASEPGSGRSEQQQLNSRDSTLSAASGSGAPLDPTPSAPPATDSALGSMPSAPVATQTLMRNAFGTPPWWVVSPPPRPLGRPSPGPPTIPEEGPTLGSAGSDTLPSHQRRESGSEGEALHSSSSTASGGSSSLANDILLSWVKQLEQQQQQQQGAEAAAVVMPPALPPATSAPAAVQRFDSSKELFSVDTRVLGPSPSAPQPAPIAVPATVDPGVRPAGDWGGSGGSGGSGSSGLHRGVSRRSSGMVDIKTWEFDYSQLEMQKAIGQGSFGKVYLAKWHETLVAVKLLLSLQDIQQTPDTALTLSSPVLINLQKECALMASLCHPNIVQFMGVSAMPPAMITEYCAKGSLTDVLRSAATSAQRAALLTWQRRLSMALGAAKGMLHLHEKQIVHRDLKSPNLLVDSSWRVKIADFNLSKIIDVDGQNAKTGTMAGANPKWLAPEVINGKPATTKADVFSFGVVLWEMLTWTIPWHKQSPWIVVAAVVDGDRLPIPAASKLPGAKADNKAFAAQLPAYIALIQRCWAQDPAERPEFKEIVPELRRMWETTINKGGGSG